MRARAASQRAYERGRLELAGARSVTFGLASAGLSLLFVGTKSLLWLPVTLLVWALLEWRGVGLLRGGRVGALAGALTLALPMSVLHRCCKPGALRMVGADCCSMPGACAGAGVAIGLVLACLLPASGRLRETVLGMALGILAVAPMKCASLLLGEAVGLVGGLLAGAALASAVRALVGSRSART